MPDNFKIVNPLLTVEAAERAKLPITLALALVSQESSGGHNYWGGDPTNFEGGVDARGKHRGLTGTKAAYLSYKAQRGTGGEQGVGPTQLTSASLQDKADRLGGSWEPLPNMIVGFEFLKQLVDTNGLFAGVALYNGGLPYSAGYAEHVSGLEKAWAEALGVKSIQVK